MKKKNYGHLGSYNLTWAFCNQPTLSYDLHARLVSSVHVSGSLPPPLPVHPLPHPRMPCPISSLSFSNPANSSTGWVQLMHLTPFSSLPPIKVNEWRSQERQKEGEMAQRWMKWGGLGGIIGCREAAGRDGFNSNGACKILLLFSSDFTCCWKHFWAFSSPKMKSPSNWLAIFINIREEIANNDKLPKGGVIGGNIYHWLR